MAAMRKVSIDLQFFSENQQKVGQICFETAGICRRDHV